MTADDVGKRVQVQGYLCEGAHSMGLLTCGSVGTRGRVLTLVCALAGVLVYFGPHAVSGEPRCGVNLDEPIGRNNGTVEVCGWGGGGAHVALHGVWSVLM